jgi:Protein of unknown function (DUF3089)
MIALRPSRLWRRICAFVSLFAATAFMPTVLPAQASEAAKPAAQASESAQSAAPAAAPAPAKNDYSKADSWICRPGHNEPCSVDLSTTVISTDGKLTTESFTPNPNARIDCFYVYPTISTQLSPNSDMTLGPEEKGVVRAQFARFGSQCRLFAPLYRQVTLAALRQLLTGGMSAEAGQQARILAYRDVLDAWHYYLEHDSHGRGFVLIGHSQGSNVLLRLIREEIDGKPLQSRLISAILPGTSVPVPKGKDVGGVFQHVPLCHAPSQTGCLITYASFRATSPPPDNTRFGRVGDPTMMAACVNPAALSGGSGELHAYLPSGEGSSIVNNASSPQPPWVTPPVPINTPFVSVPGMLTAECVSNEHGSYLAISIHADPASPRAHDIGGDLMINGTILADWGLHLIDMNLAMGNLVDIVAHQSTKYEASTKK